MWTYKTQTGELFSSLGELVSKGYSGNGRGRNNSKLQRLKGVGPLPLGKWRIGEMYDSERVGRNAIKLYAVDATPNNDTHDATGRGAFRVHGDNARGDGSASNGCLIFPRLVRLRLAKHKGEIINCVA